jgi:glycosyltransferase involved in cell wall biosynthesis
LRSPSVALVHDYLLVMRGAERTFAAIAECWPEAPIYTLLYDAEGTKGRFADREVHTSYLQRLGVGQRRFRSLLPAFPRATRSLRLDGHDLVVSSSSAFAHGVEAPAGSVHVCYCHTPFRYAWFERERALDEVARPLRPALDRTLRRVREVDRRAARRVSRYVANSEITRKRIARYWERQADVVHPPVEVERFAPAAQLEPFFLVVTELVRHKRVDLALEATRRAGVALWVVGEGPERERLEARYGGPDGTARFLGRVDDARLADLYSRAQALLLPNVEEFGIAAVEAQAAGRPVVAFAAGGVLETVRDGETGILVEPGNVEAMGRELAATDFGRFDSERIARHARTFSKTVFQERLRREVERASEPAGTLQAAAATSPPSTLP